MIYSSFFFFFFNDTATTEIYTLSLHDALPISFAENPTVPGNPVERFVTPGMLRSEEHTSELQSQSNLVCRLLLEKKKTKNDTCTTRRPHDQHRPQHAHRTQTRSPSATHRTSPS